MRKSLLLPLVILSPLAHADLAGVWQGTLGKTAITACFNASPNSGASYYYQRFLAPIQLTRDQAGEPWVEEGKTGLWQLETPQGDLFLRLQRVANATTADGCASDAYNDPIEAGPPATKVEKKTFQSHPYQVKTQGAQVTLTLGGSAPGIARINQDLARLAIPPEGQKDFYRERRTALGQNGGTASPSGSPSGSTAGPPGTAAMASVGACTPGICRQEKVPTPGPGSADITSATPPTPAISGCPSRSAPGWLTRPVDEGCPAITDYSNFDLTFDTQGMKLSTPATGDGCDNELSFTWEQLQPVLSDQGKAALPCRICPREVRGGLRTEPRRVSPRGFRR